MKKQINSLEELQREKLLAQTKLRVIRAEMKNSSADLVRSGKFVIRNIWKRPLKLVTRLFRRPGLTPYASSATPDRNIDQKTEAGWIQYLPVALEAVRIGWTLYQRHLEKNTKDQRAPKQTALEELVHMN